MPLNTFFLKSSHVAAAINHLPWPASGYTFTENAVDPPACLDHFP